MRRWLLGVMCSLALGGCFSPSDDDGDSGSGGASGEAGSGGAGEGGSGGSGGSGECMLAGDCRLIDDRCCACEPPTVNEVRAVAIDSMDFGMPCTVLCGECPEPVLPVTTVAECVDGTCMAVELSQQSYTECASDLDCELLPISCCGFCGQASLQNSFSDNLTDGLEACTPPQPCPDIGCPPTEILVEAFCTADKHCSVRSL